MKQIRLHLSALFMGLAVVSLTLVPVPGAQAQNDWLEQGTGLLKKLGQNENTAAGLPLADIVAGLKQALEKGSANVVSQVSALDGFNTDPKIHIPLPGSLSMAKQLLDKAGLGSYTADLELKLNRAAEAAAPEAKALFLDAITQMRFQDARAILDGPDDAATQYFREKMSPGLARAMAPVVDQTLSQVGAVQAYDALVSQYKTLPFVPDIKADLNTYVVDKGMDGIFHYLAEEEKAIRENPAKRTTDLLKKVFQ